MKTTFLSIIFLLTLYLCAAQTVTTVIEGDFYDDLAQDQAGNLYGSDYFGNTVYKYDTNGVVSIFKDGLSNPNGIGFNPQNEIFICDHTANTIYKYDTDGTLLETFTGIITPSGVKNIPGTEDMIYVEYGTNKVGVLSPDGSTTILYTGGDLNGPAGIAYINNELFISNYNDRKVLRVENGSLVAFAQLPAEANNSNFLGFIDAHNGAIYATSLGGHKIYQIDPVTGDYFSWAGSVHGSDDGFIEDATFCFPNGILFDDATDRLFISEAGTDNLRIIEGVSLGLEELFASKIGLQLVHNTVQDMLELKGDFELGSLYNLRVYNMQGQLHLEREYIFSSSLDRLELSTANWSTGAYIIELGTGVHATAKKFLK